MRRHPALLYLWMAGVVLIGLALALLKPLPVY